MYNKFLINGRKLKSIIPNKKKFSDWARKHIDKCIFTENEDYLVKKEGKKINYFFTIEAAEKIILNHRENIVIKKIREELAKGVTLDIILKQIEKEKECQIQIIKINDEEYPENLRKIKNPPKQLYVKGNIENLKETGIAVIGTRHCTIYGRKMCRIFANNLVGYNLNIISGLAVGIDGCAHRACIEAKGKTIAVLPSGFNNIFPKENEELVNRILEAGGTIVTEYSSDFEKTADSCRERNRIISGLAIGTLVVEAGTNSGTSITVRNTIEQNKKAFCIPASLINLKGIGTNEMIKKNQAKLVTNVEDIIKEFPELKLQKKSDFEFAEIDKKKTKKQKEDKQPQNLEIEEENKELYNLLTHNAKEVDEIARELNKPISEISYKLTMLELQGAVKELPGKKFIVKKGK